MSKLAKLLNLIRSAPSVAGNIGKKYPSTPDLQAFLRSNSAHFKPRQGRSLDLGSGPVPRNPFQAKEVHGIDLRCWSEFPGILQADLSTTEIPFRDSEFDYCTAFDFLEHIPRIQQSQQQSRFPFVELMDEIHRILAPGGLFLHQTPAFPSKEAFQDPTHVNIITEDTFPNYFCQAPHETQPLARIYGFRGEFKLIRQCWMGPWLLGLFTCEKVDSGHR